MALATQCPHCHTTFRVAHDQLKLRAGLVRCGSCKEIFNGIEHLLPTEAAAATSAPAPIESRAPANSTDPSPAAAAIPEPAASAASKPSVSDQLDFVYPDMDDEESAAPVSGLATPASIPDTVLEPPSNEPVEVDFVETPRKTPLATAAIVDHDAVDSEPVARAPVDRDQAHLPHGEAPIVQAAPPDPLTRMTLVDVEVEGGEPPPVDPDAPDPLDKVMEDFERKPARGKRGNVRGRGKPYARSPLVGMPEEMPREEPSLESEAGTEESAAAQHESAAETYSESEEPDFVKRERYKRTRGRTISILMNSASALMLLLALGQCAYIFRDQLAARFPETRPTLQSFCSLLDCKVGLPEQIDALLIEAESDHLEKLNTRKDTSELTLVMRNTASVLQAWPQLELTLKDTSNVPLARRVFSPEEYLPAGVDPKKGFAASAEQPVKLYIEFADGQPANYSVGLFYR